MLIYIKQKIKKRSNAAAANIVIKQPLPITPKTSNGNASFLLEYQNTTLLSITKKEVLPLRQVEIAPSRKRPQRLVVQLLFVYYRKTNDIVKHKILIEIQISLLSGKQKGTDRELVPRAFIKNDVSLTGSKISI